MVTPYDFILRIKNLHFKQIVPREGTEVSFEW